LSAISSGFTADKAPNWPASFKKGPKNDGVASTIANINCSVGYVQDTYARQKGLKTASVQNRAGQFVQPTLATANQAMGGATWNSDFTVEIANPSQGYPIVGTTWLLIRTEYPASKLQDIKDMLTWILGPGQNENSALEYTSIPQDVRQRALARLPRITAKN
jgi:phosphate transport system substrate-binding protein